MPEPTTTSELEDWHARRAGWTFKHGSWWHEKLHGPICEHPIAPTIDAAVLAFPEGWKWQRRSKEMYGWHDDKDPQVWTDITGHTPDAIRRDLLTLARLAWIAEGAEP